MNKLSMDSLLAPLQKGEYNVGCTDIECKEQNLNYTLLFKIYYPTKDAFDSSKCASWIPDEIYYHGLCSTLGYSKVLFGSTFKYLLSGVRIAAMEEASVFNSKFPVFIVSHARGAIRTSYSVLCSSLASRGSIVVVMEHRDHSAYVTTISSTVVNYKQSDSSMIEERFSKAQQSKRIDEILSCIETLKKLNSGDAIELETTRIRQLNFHMNMFKEILNMESIILIGHSFAAEAVVETSQRESSVKGIVLLDPIFNNVNCVRCVPTLVVNSWHFQKYEAMENIRNYLKRMKELGSNKNCFSVHILMSTHVQFDDMAFLVPKDFIESCGSLMSRKMHEALVRDNHGPSSRRVLTLTLDLVYSLLKRIEIDLDGRLKDIMENEFERPVEIIVDYIV